MSIMGSDSLKSNLTNPARSYLFDVLIPSPIGGGDFETLLIRARASQIPGRSNDPIEIPYKQTAGIVVAGKSKYSHSWTCTFMEGEDKKVFDAMNGWQQKITHNVFGIGVGDPFYKADVYLALLTTGGDTSMKLKLKGAWVQDVGQVTLSYEQNTIITYDVTFSFDRFEDVT